MYITDRHFDFSLEYARLKHNRYTQSLSQTCYDYLSVFINPRSTLKLAIKYVSIGQENNFNKVYGMLVVTGSLVDINHITSLLSEQKEIHLTKLD